MEGRFIEGRKDRKLNSVSEKGPSKGITEMHKIKKEKIGKYEQKTHKTLAN